MAVDGDEYVGMSNLWDDRASDALYTGLTGVKRSHRRRGIATALKVRAIAYARAHRSPAHQDGQRGRPTGPCCPSTSGWALYGSRTGSALRQEGTS